MTIKICQIKYCSCKQCVVACERVRYYARDTYLKPWAQDSVTVWLCQNNRPVHFDAQFNTISFHISAWSHVETSPVLLHVTVSSSKNEIKRSDINLLRQLASSCFTTINTQAKQHSSTYIPRFVWRVCVRAQSTKWTQDRKVWKEWALRSAETTIQSSKPSFNDADKLTWLPLSGQEVATPRISKQSSHDSVKVVSRTHQPPLPLRR